MKRANMEMCQFNTCSDRTEIDGELGKDRIGRDNRG